MLPIIPSSLIQKIVEVENQTVTEPPMLETSNLTIQAELKAGEMIKDMVQRSISIGQASHLKNISHSIDNRILNILNGDKSFVFFSFLIFICS